MKRIIQGLDNKKPLSKGQRFFCSVSALHSAGDLARTEATGADVHVLGSAVHNSLDPLDVGLPGPVGATVGVGDLDAEAHALVAEFAFSHFAIPSLLAG